MNKETFSTILPKDLIERIRKFSNETGISQAHMTEKAFKKYLDEMEKKIML
jgi:predicted DNA-binding protein